MKNCSLRVPAHDMGTFLDRFADDLIDFLESKELFKLPTSEVAATKSRHIVRKARKREPAIKDPSKQEFLELIHDLKEFVIQRTTVQEYKPTVFAGECAVFGLPHHLLFICEGETTI